MTLDEKYFLANSVQKEKDSRQLDRTQATAYNIGSITSVVTKENFSCNPNIARFLHEYDYVQEFGEGVDRMFKEMAVAGLPAPEYRSNAFMLNVTIRNGVINDVINGAINGAINISAAEQTVLAQIKKNPKITKVTLQKETALGKSTIDRAMKALKEKSLIERVGSNKTGYWKIIK